MKKIFALFALLLCFVQFSQAGDKVTRVRGTERSVYDGVR